MEAEARRSNNLVSIGMAGTLVELLRIRVRTSERAVLTGTVAYRERIALPPGAVVQVQLADVSKQDVASTTVAEATIEPGGRQVPIPFELPYDPMQIDPKGAYAVRATIRDGGDLIFTTTTVYAVITRGNPSHVELVLQRVPSGPR